MNIYQLQFQDHTLRWRGVASFQMVPALFREFLDYLIPPSCRCLLGGRGSDVDYRVIRIKGCACSNPHYRYNGANNLVDLWGLGPH